MNEQKMFKPITNHDGKLLFKWDSKNNIVEIIKKRHRILVHLKNTGEYVIETKIE